mgnify:CR=1 FL=1
MEELFSQQHNTTMVTEAIIEQQELAIRLEKQRKLEELLRTIPSEEPNLELVLKIGKVLEDSKGSSMLTSHIMREAARMLVIPEETAMVHGEAIVISPQFPGILFDEGDGVFGEDAMQIERRTLATYMGSLNFEPPFFVKWKRSYEEHHGISFNPVEVTQ